MSGGTNIGTMAAPVLPIPLATSAAIEVLEPAMDDQAVMRTILGGINTLKTALVWIQTAKCSAGRADTIGGAEAGAGAAATAVGTNAVGTDTIGGAEAGAGAATIAVGTNAMGTDAIGGAEAGAGAAPTA